MATNYQRGRAFEYRTRDALLRRGAVYVMRAAQSKGLADLAAFWPPVEGGMGKLHRTAPWLVQCKTGSARMKPAEIEVLKNTAYACGAQPVLAEPGPKNRGVKFTDLYSMEEL